MLLSVSSQIKSSFIPKVMKYLWPGIKNWPYSCHYFPWHQRMYLFGNQCLFPTPSASGNSPRPAAQRAQTHERAASVDQTSIRRRVEPQLHWHPAAQNSCKGGEKMSVVHFCITEVKLFFILGHNIKNVLKRHKMLIKPIKFIFTFM